MDYYISAFGNDSNSGISQKQPWQSIDRVNATQLLAGDSVMVSRKSDIQGQYLTLFRCRRQMAYVRRINKRFGSYGETAGQ